MSDRGYLMYYHYENLSLIDSSIALFKALNIDVLHGDDFEYHGGHWGWLVNEHLFFVAQAYNIAKASAMERDLLVLEEDAYINLIFAKKHIEENPTLFAVVESELARFNLQYSQDTKITYIADLLANDKILSRISQQQTLRFDDFSVSIFHSSRQMPQTNSLEKILRELHLKVVYDEHYAFFQNEMFSPKLTYKYSAKMLENALDMASDFVLCNSMGAFEIFDKERKKLSKAINRDLGDIAVLFLPQVILMSFGEKDDVALATRYHKNIPDFI